MLSFAGPVAATDKAPVTIAILGDSLTQGFGLPPDDGLVPRTQAYLDVNGVPARLINAGVSGDTTAGGLARIAWTLTPEVDGVVVILGGNDFLRGIDPDVSAANLEGIVTTARESGVAVALVGLPAPANFGAAYKARFDAIYPSLAQSHDLPLLPDLFAPIRGDGTPAALLANLQGDGIHPSARGVQAIVAGGFGAFVAAFAAQLAEGGES